VASAIKELSNGKCQSSKKSQQREFLVWAGAKRALNACVGRNGGPADFWRYASGYFTAAELLLKCLRDDSTEVDILVYPLVMNYRHGVEDMLKQLAATVSVLCTGKQEVFFTHKLVDNWSIAKRYLPRIDVSGADLDKAESIIKDLVEIDPTGETFRYPRSRNGAMHLEDVSLINVERFGESMAELAEILDLFTGWARQNLEWKAEMESEMRV
jgi:hypothetical protein